MNRKIKLIWDFRSEVAFKIAENHSIDTKAFMAHKEIEFFESGAARVSDYHSISYLVVAESNMIFVRDILKPHRAEVVE